MKGKNLVVSGLMLLLTMPLVNCGGGGGGGGNPGNTGVEVQNIAVTGTQEIGVTAGVETASFSITAAQQGAVNPFPATVDACTITYVPAVAGSPEIAPYSDNAPNCVFNAGTSVCANINLIDATRKAAFAAAVEAGDLPDYPANYTVRYSCDYRSTISNNGNFSAEFDIVLGLNADLLAVTPNTATIAQNGTKTFIVSLGVPPYVISNEADTPADLVDVLQAGVNGESITVNGNSAGAGTVTITVQDSTVPVAQTKTFTVTVQ